MKSRFLEKLIERIDRIDTDNLQAHMLRLAQEQGLLQTILSAIQEGLIVIDEKGVITYANPAAETLLGFSAESAEGQPIDRYLREIDWDRVVQLDESEWSNLVNREIEITYPRHRFVNFYVVPLAAVNPEAVGAVVILRDVTSDRENHESTLESERLSAVTLLAAGIAHEIGNPLNSLTIHLQLIAQELATFPEEQGASLRELVDITHQEVSRLDQIINQFLQALRPMEPEFERRSLLEVLEQTLSFLQPEIEDRNVLIEVEADDLLPDCVIDGNQIKQAFYNIIRNAMQAMEGGGLIKIQLSSNERVVGIAFSDTGPGINPEDIGHLFEAYRTTKSEGSGLGLMIVQRIIRDHGGEIEVRSEPGSGTTFSIFLPRDERRIRLLKAPPKPASSPSPDAN